MANLNRGLDPGGNAIVSFFLRRDLPFDKLNTNGILLKSLEAVRPEPVEGQFLEVPYGLHLTLSVIRWIYGKSGPAWGEAPMTSASNEKPLS